jgi:hypothetical protein
MDLLSEKLINTNTPHLQEWIKKNDLVERLTTLILSPIVNKTVEQDACKCLDEFESFEDVDRIPVDVLELAAKNKYNILLSNYIKKLEKLKDTRKSINSGVSIVADLVYYAGTVDKINQGETSTEERFLKMLDKDHASLLTQDIMFLTDFFLNQGYEFSTKFYNVIFDYTGKDYLKKLHARVNDKNKFAILPLL